MNSVFRTLKRIAFFNFLVVTVTLAGCNSDGNPKTYEVSGTLTLNGQPVDGATIVLIPKGTGAYPATAVSNADGTFQLTTFNANDGAVPGDYSVKISKMEYKEEAVSDTQVFASSEEENENYELTESSAAPPKNLLPAKYANPMTSELIYSVPEEASTFNIDLK